MKKTFTDPEIEIVKFDTEETMNDEFSSWPTSGGGNDLGWEK